MYTVQSRGTIKWDFNFIFSHSKHSPAALQATLFPASATGGGGGEGVGGGSSPPPLLPALKSSLSQRQIGARDGGGSEFRVGSRVSFNIGWFNLDWISFGWFNLCLLNLFWFDFCFSKVLDND